MNEAIELAPNVSWTTIEGQTVLFSKLTGDFYGLNPTATYLVQEVVKTGVDATVSEAAKKFGVDEPQIRGNLDEILRSLLEAQLVVVRPEGK